MKRRTSVLAAAASVTALVGAGLLSAAGPAAADLTTRCVGEGGAVTVPGNLVVPKGQSCLLTGTTVAGDVRVAAGADLIADGATFEGQVTVAADGYLEASASTFNGQVVLRSAYGAYLDGSSVADRVRSNSAQAAETGLLYVLDTDVAGDVRSNSDEVLLEGATVGGTVATVGSSYTDVYDSFIDGVLQVKGSELGSIVCSSAVQGAGRFLENGGPVEIGTGGSDCGSGGYWAANLVVRDTTGGVGIDNAIVGNNLVLDGNDPIAELGSVVVRGDIRGDYDDAADAAAKSPALGKKSLAGKASVQSRGAAPADRTDALRHALTQRGAVAQRDAAKAGSANLG